MKWEDAGPCRPEVMNELLVDLANSLYRRAVVADFVKKCGGMKAYRKLRAQMERAA